MQILLILILYLYSIVDQQDDCIYEIGWEGTTYEGAKELEVMSHNPSKVTVLNGRMSHLCAIIGSSMFMVGGYHKQENEARLKDRDVTVDMSDINVYSLTDVSFKRSCI